MAGKGDDGHLLLALERDLVQEVLGVDHHQDWVRLVNMQPNVAVRIVFVGPLDDQAQLGLLLTERRKLLEEQHQLIESVPPNFEH